jgi:hypothetical protein
MTITAWQTQFAAWAPDINVTTYIGNAPAREIIRTYFEQEAQDERPSDGV